MYVKFWKFESELSFILYVTNKVDDMCRVWTNFSKVRSQVVEAQW